MSLIAALLLIASVEQATPASDEASAPLPATVEEQVEVVADAPDVDDVAAFATKLDATELAGRGLELADLLRRVPGARVRDYGGLGSYATMSLRGSTSEQVTVLVDGVPQNRALGGAVDLSSIPSTQLEQVTVYRGFAPAAYGTGGIGGVVDVRTRAPESDPATRLDVVAGELSSARLSADLSLPTGGQSRLRIGAEAQRSDGDFYYLDTLGTPFNPADDVVRRRDNNDHERQAFLLQQIWDDVSGGRVQLGLRLQRRQRGVPGLGSRSSGSARLDDSLQDFNAHWSQRNAGHVDSYEMFADGYRQKNGFEDLAGEIGLSAQDQTTRLAGGGMGGLVRGGIGGHRLLARLDLRHETAEVRDDALERADRGGADRTLFAATLEDLITLGPVTLAPSVRWQYHRDDFESGGEGTLPPPASDVSEGNWSGKLGVAHRLGRRSQLRGSLGHFYRIPNLLELFGDRGVIVGNPGLQPESGFALDLGYSTTRSPGNVSISGEIAGFARRTEDLIHFLPVSQGAAVAQNVSDVEVVGLEAAISLTIGSAWSVEASGTLQETTDVSGGFSDGNPLPYEPAKLGYFGVAWNDRGMHARWDITYTGENSTDVLDTPELRLPARVMHDVYFGLDRPSGLSFGIDVRNVFDRMTRDLLRYPLPGRVVLLHVGWRSGRTS